MLDFYYHHTGAAARIHTHTTGFVWGKKTREVWVGLTISAAATTTAAAVLSITFGQRSRDVIGVNLLVTTVMSDIMDDLIPGLADGLSNDSVVFCHTQTGDKMKDRGVQWRPPWSIDGGLGHTSYWIFFFVCSSWLGVCNRANRTVSTIVNKSLSNQRIFCWSCVTIW